TAQAYNFFYSIASAAILIPYAFSAFYQLKYSIKEDKTSGRTRNIVIGVVSSIYACWLLFAAGKNFLLLMSLLFAAGIPVYWILQKKDNKAKRVFGPIEMWVAIFVCAAAIYTIFGLISKQITF
ncbi:arginine-ornithine antiporter, partial [Lactobacillus bombi]|nr:arginine-ornithine antiporter [Bombilactobacillus bombi]